MIVEPYTMDSESEADEYLDGLFKEPKNRSMDEVHMRAQKLIKDPNIKKYFVNKAKEMLRAFGHEI